MPSADRQHPRSDLTGGQSPIHCDECRSAIRSDRQQAVSFLLLDQLTIPVLSCDDHLERFASICGLTSESTADLLNHRPAGGICCPSCRLAPYNSSRPVIPIEDGVLVPMACPEHQSEIVQRFHTGLQTQQQLSTSLRTTTNGSL
ncbi:hypothetical protein HYG81_03190 [Natrinema zhouii]|uniref:Uncharacterized protein n=1 Tax=Natrinema zhouii TaxID=1710539 RepID=A0A7D6CQG7_9EURY|nr:hypothetical protein [Natrinema zhouii]QLK26636.1 hypothetical protein HYG81_03190 [Natrinema zhouii]